MKTIHDRIKALRLEGETQIQFAERLGTTQASISRYLNGRQPDRETLIKIADKTNVSLDWLLTGKGRGPAGDSGEKEDEIQAAMAGIARLNGISAKERSALESLITEYISDKEKRKEIISFWEAAQKKTKK